VNRPNETTKPCKYCEGKPVVFKAETIDGWIYICGQLACTSTLEKEYSPDKPIDLYWVQ